MTGASVLIAVPRYALGEVAVAVDFASIENLYEGAERYRMAPAAAASASSPRLLGF